MALYDEIYERYGKDFALTPTDEVGLQNAREEQRKLRDDPTMTPRGDGFLDADGRFILDPETERYIRIATGLAQEQLGQLMPMPEDMDAAIRFPGVDPVWHVSVIDMKFAQREAAVKAAMETRLPEVRDYVLDTLHRFTSPLREDEAFRDASMAMTEAAQEHRTVTRASKLCHSAAGRRILHERSRALETGRAVVNYDMMMQGVEYAVGLRTGPVPEEIKTFYHDVLKADLDMDLVKKAELVRPPEQLHVEFEDLDNKMLHQAQANPHNWGKTAQEIEAIANTIDLDTVSEAITPYARATVDRVIAPAFAAQEKAAGSGVDRAELIIIDGKTVREKMLEDYTASGREAGEFEAFFQKNRVTATNEYVAAGLMAGKRVEAFIPDKSGHIPDEPTPITKAGYEPSPLKPEKFNAWQRYFSRHGYYKEKVARQQEYERMMAARERVKERQVQERLGRLKEAEAQSRHYSTAAHKEMFFGPIMDELGFKTVGADGSAQYDWGGMNSYTRERVGAEASFRQFTRCEPMDTCVAYLAAQGHSFRDIMDPTKLQAERLAAARLFMEKAATNDTQWLGQVYYAGHKALLQQAGELTRGLDLRDDRQLIRVLPEAECLLHSAFSVSQMLVDEGCTMGYYKAALAEAGGDLDRASEMAYALNNKVCDAALFAGEMLNGVKAQAAMGDPAAPVYAGHATNLGILRVMQGRMKEGASIVEKALTSEEMFEIRAAVSANTSLTNAVLDQTKTPEGRAELAVAAASGKLAEQLRTKEFRVEPTLDKEGQPVQVQDSKKVLRQNEDGSYRIEKVSFQFPTKTPSVEFELGETLSPKMEQQAPQRAAQKQTAARQHRPTQIGGPKL